MDNNELYCQQKVAIPGSACYYSMLTLSNWQRPRVIALLAFSSEIQSICLECSDHEVARSKLNFWYKELLAFNRGKSTHPITVQLQKLFGNQQLSYESLLFIIYEAQIRLQTELIFISQDLQHLERYHSIWNLLSIEVFQAPMNISQNFAILISQYFARVHVLENFFPYLKRNLHYFDFLHKEYDWQSKIQQPNFTEKLYNFLLETMAIFTEAHQALPFFCQVSQQFIIIFAQLLYLQLVKVTKGGPEKLLKNLQKGKVLTCLSPIMNYYYARKHLIYMHKR